MPPSTQPLLPPAGGLKRVDRLFVHYVIEAIDACRGMPPEVEANRAALRAEYLDLLERRALTGLYGEDVRAQPRSLSADADS
jgi:hypothetical protein